MWLVLMFDLPVDTKEARIEYRKFVKALELDGFDRMQYSVFVRFCASEENATVHQKRIARIIPPDGEVRVVQITDKQFERIKVYCGTLRPTNYDPQTEIEETEDETDLTEEEKRRKKKYMRKPLRPPDQISFF
ncbi:CRISPR-associated endonuclease Cas2 [bacterium]|nr:CRISPR-associated endonuclease Cas2 [bacterium]MBU1637633.1 CRISPR-associated endonuclease Cas2 [bacterium]